MAWPVRASSVAPSGPPDPPPVSGGSWRGADSGLYIGYALALLLLCGLAPAAAQSAPDAERCRSIDVRDTAIQVDDAISACSAIIASGSEKGRPLAEAHFLRGIGLFRKNDLNRAIADFEQAIRVDPTYPRAYVGRGNLKARQGNHDEAIADYNTAIRFEPTFAPAYTNRGVVWRNKQDYDRALADFDEAIRLNPSDARAFDLRSTVWRAKKDLDRAMADCEQAIKLDPKLASAYNSRGLIWRGKGDVDRAIADFDATIRLDPKAVYAYNNRGLAWRAKRDLARALADFDATIRADPTYVAAYTNRGLVYEAQGNRDRARAEFNAALGWPQKFDNGKWAHDTARARLALLSDAGGKSQPAAASRDRVALVIGNGAYKNVSRLPNPVNDARALARTLREIGFDVSEGADLDHRGQERLVRDFLRKAASARVVLLFYAGHGMQIDGKNYLVPVDAKLEAPTDLQFETLDLDKVLAGLDDEARTTIIILDACRDNPLARSVAGKMRSAASSGLAAVSTGTGTLIAFATAPGKTALDGTGANSSFTGALVKHIRTPGLEVRQMLTRVRAEVAAATQNKQIPWDNSSLLGEVYLAGSAKP